MTSICVSVIYCCCIHSILPAPSWTGPQHLQPLKHFTGRTQHFEFAQYHGWHSTIRRTNSMCIQYFNISAGSTMDHFLLLTFMQASQWVWDQLSIYWQLIWHLQYVYWIATVFYICLDLVVVVWQLHFYRHQWVKTAVSK